MMRISARWLVAGAVVALVLLAVNIGLTYHNTQELYQSAVVVSHTHDVLAALDNTLSLAKDAETGQRGFLITGEERYLEPYSAAVAAIHRQVDEFERLTADNPRHQARIPELRARIAAKMDELNRTIVLRRTDGPDAARAVVLTGQGKAEMDALRSLVGEMTADEQALRSERTELRDHTFHLAIIEGLSSGFCAMLAIAAFMALLRRHLASRAQAAFDIAEQGERLRTTLASIGDAVIATDVDGLITMMNAVAESLTGWKFAEARGQPLAAIFNIVNEQTRKTVESPVARVLREGVIVGLANHTVLIARDGTERPIDDSAAPIRCAKKELVGCVLVFRDVTEHRGHERVLRESEARKAAMLETALDCIISINHEGTIIEFNAAAERTFGHQRQDVLGRELAATIIPPAFRDSHRQGMARYLATGEGPVLNQRLELSALRADGSEFPVELTVTRIPGDGPPLFTAYLRDITERQRAEQALRMSEERLQVSQQIAHVGTFDWNIQTGVNVWTAELEAMYGLAPGEFARTQRAWEQLVHPDDRAAAVAAVERSLKTGEFVDEEWRVIWPDGSVHWVTGRFQGFRDNAGNPVRLAGVNIDITERKQAEEALRKAKEEAETANVAKDNFLSTLSHELRTPLTPVLAILRDWENAPRFPPELQEDLQMVRRNVDLEARLIDDLLDLTRISRGKLALNLEVMDVQKLLDSVVSMYRSEITAKKIDLALHAQAQQCFVRADPGRLQQAFWNLLKNAVKFTAEGGRIDVSTRNDANGRIQIIVQDNGIGMTPQMLARLFTPFVQETQEHFKRYGGLGLGLAITRMLLEAQNGQITAHSEGKYRGATFVITLPCVQAPVEQPDQPAQASGGNGDAKAEHVKCFRVLLVEDHLDTADVLARLMQKNGHEVTMAHSVADAISALRGQPFDMLVSDIGLPDGTGIDLIRQVRKQYGLNIPAVALTGFGMEEDVARCQEAGFDDHLTKPVNFTRLEEAIQRTGTMEKGIECPEDHKTESHNATGPIH